MAQRWLGFGVQRSSAVNVTLRTSARDSRRQGVRGGNSVNYFNWPGVSKNPAVLCAYSPQSGSDAGPRLFIGEHGARCPGNWQRYLGKSCQGKRKTRNNEAHKLVEDRRH